MKFSNLRVKKRSGLISVEVVMATGLLTLVFGAIFALTKFVLALYFDASYAVAQRPWL
jgi:hypothetical protein